MKKKINNVCKIISEKINSDLLNSDNYISTENMLPNFGGICSASSLPKGNVTSFKVNDILLSNIRPYFKKIWFSKFDGGCSNDVLVLRANNNIVMNKYLYYSLTNDNFINYYVASCKGTKMPRGNKDALLDWQINVPDLCEQQHIVNTIGSVDDLIENYQKQADKICDILRQSLNKYNEYVTISEYNPYIIKSGIKMFDNEKTYLDTSSINGVNNITPGELITYNKKPSRANMQPIGNSVWFAKMKDSNKMLIITDKDQDIINNNILSTGFLGIKSSNKLPLSLLTSIIISDQFKVQRDLNSVGTTMAGINNETFSKIIVPKLTDEEIKEYDKKYNNLVYRLSYIRQEIKLLSKVKENLLSKYF